MFVCNFGLSFQYQTTAQGVLVCFDACHPASQLCGMETGYGEVDGKVVRLKHRLCLAAAKAIPHLSGASQAVRREAPRLGGSFAVWGGLFSIFDCTLVAVRHKVSCLTTVRL